jgi:hypothetical protein
MDCATQLTLNVLEHLRRRVDRGERVKVACIPELVTSIRACPSQDQRIMFDHFAHTLAVSDNMLQHVAVYQASLYLYAFDSTSVDTVNFA